LLACRRFPWCWVRKAETLFECSFILLSWRKIPEDAVSHQALPQELAELTLNSAMQKLTKGLG
jgi:hypothetical protein